MTQNKAVFVKEIHQAFDKNNAAYTWILDQDNSRWNLFRIKATLEVNKGYVFVYETEGQFQNVKEIMPLVNIFKQQALKEVASRNDIKRDLFMSVSYAKDLCVAGQVQKAELFAMAETIYTWVTEKTTELMPKEVEIPE